jgi:twitching motility protein PilI
MDYFHIQLRQSVTVLLPLESTAEVMTLTRGGICPIPGVAHALLGVVNQRGRLLWVMELSDLLLIKPSPVPLRSQDSLTIVAISTSDSPANERRVGCVVSTLKGIVPLDPAKFRPMPTRFPPSLRSLFSGVAEVDRSPAGILNVNAVLNAIEHK